MLRRNRVIERDPAARSGSVTSRGLAVVQVDTKKCPSRLEGHDEHSSFDQCDRPSPIGPIRKIRQSRFITVASGNVIVLAATNALGLVQEVFANMSRSENLANFREANVTLLARASPDGVPVMGC